MAGAVGFKEAVAHQMAAYMKLEHNLDRLFAYARSWFLPFKQGRFRSLAQEGLWIVVGQAAAVAGVLVGIRVLTELLDPVAYGELALGMTAALLINQTVFGPLGNGVARFYAPAVEQDDFHGYLTVVRRLVLAAIGIIIFMILVAVVALQIAGQSEWIAITIAALIFAMLIGCNSILSGIQNAARQRSIVALHQGMDYWMRFLVATGLVLWFGATSTVVMFGYAISSILVLISQFLFFRKIAHRYTPKVNKEKGWQAQIWAYSWPFLAWGTFSWVHQSSDRWVLERFATIQDVGLYSVLFQLGYYPISVAAGMATQFLAPILYQRAGDASDSRRTAHVSHLSWYFTGLALGMTGAAFLVALSFHRQIFQIFVGKEYAIVSYLLPWMLLASGIFVSGQSISLNLMSQMKTRIMVMAKIITAVVGVIFNVAGAYWYGIMGVVMASVLFSVVYFLWMLVLFQGIAVNSNSSLMRPLQ